MPTTTNTNGAFASVNGLNMYYEIHGDGEPLVLIHGGGSTIETNFAKLIPLLQNDFQLIAVELQAHGHTSDRNAPETFEQDADDVAALLQQLSVDKANFLGFSNGGNTTMQVAIRHSAIVNKLVLASTFYKREGLFAGFFEMMQNVTIADMPQPLKDGFIKINPDPAALQNMFEKDRARMVGFKDCSDDDINSIKNPTLLISGDRDVATLAHVLQMQQLIKDSRLMILPSGHGDYLGEICAPPDNQLLELTTRVIIKFLKS